MEYFQFVELLKKTGIAWHTAMEISSCRSVFSPRTRRGTVQNPGPLEGEIRFSSATDEATSSESLLAGRRQPELAARRKQLGASGFRSTQRRILTRATRLGIGMVTDHHIELA